MSEFLAGVHHEKLNLDFSVKINPEMFNSRKADDIVECFESADKSRKFLKGFLTLKIKDAPVIKKKKGE